MASGRALERGLPDELPVGYDAARSQVKLIAPAALHASPPPAVIFVDTSQDFARGHVPGARWVPRGWLELWIGDIVPVEGHAGGGHVQRWSGLGPRGARPSRSWATSSVSVLDGGMDAWQKAGLPVGTGLSGVMAAPTDVVLAGPDRNFADMQNYLRWEEALGYKYAAAAVALGGPS